MWNFVWIVQNWRKISAEFNYSQEAEIYHWIQRWVKYFNEFFLNISFTKLLVKSLKTSNNVKNLKNYKINLTIKVIIFFLKSLNRMKKLFLENHYSVDQMKPKEAIIAKQIKFFTINIIIDLCLLAQGISLWFIQIIIVFKRWVNLLKIKSFFMSLQFFYSLQLTLRVIVF